MGIWEITGAIILAAILAPVVIPLGWLILVTLAAVLTDCLMRLMEFIERMINKD